MSDPAPRLGPRSTRTLPAQAFEYQKELLKTEADPGCLRFEPSPLDPDKLAARAVQVGGAEGPLTQAWQAAFELALDSSVFDDDGPLWKMQLITEGGQPAETPPDDAPSDETSPVGTSVLVYSANHAISDQLSHQRVLGEVSEICPRYHPGSEPRYTRDRPPQVLDSIAAARAGEPPPPSAALPLPPSVEAALVGDLGTISAQSDDFDTRWRRMLSRARFSSARYGWWQCNAGGAAVRPRWIPPAQQLTDTWSAPNRRSAAIFAEIAPSVCEALRTECRARDVTISSALCAAAVRLAAD